MAEPIVWAGSTLGCDVCGNAFAGKLYDAKTKHGPWGTLCEACFKQHGVGLGTGKGQTYECDATGQYVKVAG